MSVTYAGGFLTVDGTNFAPNEVITLTLYSRPVFLGTTKTNRNCSFSITVTIPSNTDPGG